MNDLIDDNQKVIALKELQQTEGWRVLQKVLLDNSLYFEEIILRGTDDQGRRLERDNIDRMRNRRELLLELLNAPKNIILQLDNSSDDESDKLLDPYYDPTDKTEKN